MITVLWPLICFVGALGHAYTAVYAGEIVWRSDRLFGVIVALGFALLATRSLFDGLEGLL